MSGLSIRIDVGPPVTIVTLAGEIDLANAEELGRDLAAAAKAATDGLVVDVGGVTYLDSAGLGTLFTLARQLDDRGVPFVVVVPDGSPLGRLFSITQFQRTAPLAESVEEATRVIAGPPTRP